MSSTTLPGHVPGLLDRERTIAGLGFNRWLVPPAALASTCASARPTRSACSTCR